MRRMDGEIQKLALYADGRTIQPKDIDLMVADTSQDRIFNVMDAIIEGRHNLAIGGVQNLIANGESIEGNFRFTDPSGSHPDRCSAHVESRSTKIRDWSASTYKYALVVGQNLQASITNRIETLEGYAPAHVGLGCRIENGARGSSVGG